MYILVDYRL